MQAVTKFVPIVLGIQFLFVTVGIVKVWIRLTVACALVIAMDVMFRKYVDKTIDFFDASGSLLTTVTFSGAFAWVHFNVFSVTSFSYLSNNRGRLVSFPWLRCISPQSS